MNVLDRDKYGWVEFIQARSCSSPEEVSFFYERQGAYLALLYVLEATDFHSENLVAAGPHPVLVDLESLFQPREQLTSKTSSQALAASVLAHSVLRSGLLPSRIWANDEHEGIDLSGLGAPSGQMFPRPVPYWENAGTDLMRLERKRLPIPANRNRPTFNGEDVNVLDYSEAIVTGFERTYQLLMSQQSQLLSRDGPLSKFADDEIRAIARSTRSYALLLYESSHPYLLRNALDRDRFFDRLWVGVNEKPALIKLIPSEREDLQNGDIPMFATRPNSRGVWSSANEYIEDVYEESAMDLVERRIARLNEKDCKQQIWFIRASLTTLDMNAKSTQWPSYDFKQPDQIAGPEALLAAAQDVGARLEELALQDEESDLMVWIGLNFVDERYWKLVTLDIDLYSGLPGVALFMAYLGHLTRHDRYTGIAGACLATLRQLLANRGEAITAIGGFSGLGGVIYVLTHLAALWHEPALIREAEALVERLPQLIDRDESLDITDGAAGCLVCLLCLYAYSPSPMTLEAAVRCGDKLIAAARAEAQGIAWVTRSTTSRPLTGFSHGAAGMAWSLLKLADVTNEGRFRTTALAAMTYERSTFSDASGNWPDFRLHQTSEENGEGAQTFTVAWCHGAPGIGLARLSSLNHTEDAFIRQEIDTAIRTTLAHGFGHNHSLCHGDLGNLELILEASSVLADPDLRVHVERLRSIILNNIRENRSLCGVPLGVETPGLMNGLAGVGYGLLRQASPASVPSVLLLSPPVLEAQRPI